MLSVNKVQSNPAFTSMQRFKAIKMIPNITCACCGQKVITPEVADRAWGAVAKPLSTAVKKGAFSNLTENFPQVSILLKSFAERFPKLSLDRIIYNDENYFGTTIYNPNGKKIGLISFAVGSPAGAYWQSMKISYIILSNETGTYLEGTEVGIGKNNVQTITNTSKHKIVRIVAYY